MEAAWEARLATVARGAPLPFAGWGNWKTGWLARGGYPGYGGSSAVAPGHRRLVGRSVRSPSMPGCSVWCLARQRCFGSRDTLGADDQVTGQSGSAGVVPSL